MRFSEVKAPSRHLYGSSVSLMKDQISLVQMFLLKLTWISASLFLKDITPLRNILLRSSSIVLNRFADEDAVISCVRFPEKFLNLLRMVSYLTNFLASIYISKLLKMWEVHFTNWFLINHFPRRKSLYTLGKSSISFSVHEKMLFKMWEKVENID